MSPDSEKPERSQITDSMLDSAGDYAQRFTLALCAEEGTKRELFGTGVLLRIWQQEFIVTAGHVVTLMQRARAGVTLWARHPLTGQLWTLNHVDYACVDDDRSDIGVIGLPYPVGLKLADPSNYLDLGQLQTADLKAEGEDCLVCGFPSVLYVAEPPKVRCLRYLTTSRDEERREVFDPRTDILLSYRPGKQQFQGVELADLPIHGMSGGGIWRFFDTVSDRAWQTSDLRLAGIQHGWRKNEGLLRGSRIAAALQLIAKRWPDLSTLIRKYHPDEDGE
jgi:hypothetical protein